MPKKCTEAAIQRTNNGYWKTGIGWNQLVRPVVFASAVSHQWCCVSSAYAVVHWSTNATRCQRSKCLERRQNGKNPPPPKYWRSISSDTFTPFIRFCFSMMLCLVNSQLTLYIARSLKLDWSIFVTSPFLTTYHSFHRLCSFVLRCRCNCLSELAVYSLKCKRGYWVSCVRNLPGTQHQNLSLVGSVAPTPWVRGGGHRE